MDANDPLEPLVDPSVSTRLRASLVVPRLEAPELPPGRAANADAEMPVAASPRLRDLHGCLVAVRQRLTATAERGVEKHASALVDRAIDMAEYLLSEERSRAVACAPRSGKTLRIGPEARWFELDGAARVSLRRRRALPSVLLALAESADTPLGYGELVAAGWPGERVLANAAELRVRAAISTLRALGLRDVVTTTSAGYALEADVVFADDRD